VLIILLGQKGAISCCTSLNKFVLQYLCHSDSNDNLVREHKAQRSSTSEQQYPVGYLICQLQAGYLLSKSLHFLSIFSRSSYKIFDNLNLVSHMVNHLHVNFS
jgi:hypothetical protein